LNPQIWLYRYKRGFMARTDPHSGYNYDNTRGWVHPAHWVGGTVSGRNLGGGAHSSRGGLVGVDRPTEWSLSNANRYDAVFEPNLWFLTQGAASQLSYPIQPIPGASGAEVYNIGPSGQGTNDTGTRHDILKDGFCGSSQTKGVQRQWFAFACVVETEPGKFIRGPLSEPISASIWPKVKTNYSTPPLYSRGRKIRLLHK
jgi:hypothetical protein